MIKRLYNGFTETARPTGCKISKDSLVQKHVMHDSILSTRMCNPDVFDML